VVAVSAGPAATVGATFSRLVAQDVNEPTADKTVDVITVRYQRMIAVIVVAPVAASGRAAVVRSRAGASLVVVEAMLNPASASGRGA
jgi:hypothetical protein